MFSYLLDSNERPETNTALSTAERLVKEFQSNEDPFKAEVLQNLVLAASKSKPNAERALNNFVEIGQKKVIFAYFYLI